MTNVFVSYGHNVFDELAKRVVKDLEAEGDFDVFLDLECLEKGDWERLITQAIERCDYFVFFVSSKSVSNDGYCLNELSRACELQKPVIPVLLDESYVPLCITRLQRLNLKAALNVNREVVEETYAPTYARLVRLLRGQEKLGFFNKDYAISNQLQTFSAYEIGDNVKDFVGREAAIQDFLSWLDNPASLPVYLLEAAPGIGKSALCAALSVRYPGSVAAIHFCVYGNQAKTDAKNIITNLACQLSYRNEEFAALLNDALKREDLAAADPKRLFEVLLLEPGKKVSFPTPQVLMIDALDEAVDQGKNEIADLLFSFHNALPSWMRFYCSSRPQENVTAYFRYFHIYRIDETSEQNHADIEAYYAAKLPRPLDDEEKALLMKKSHGSFLYAQCIVKAVAAKELNLDNISGFPDGIYSYYAIWFNRLFASYSYDKARPILSVLPVASAAPNVDFLVDALGMEERDVNDVTTLLSSFFRFDEDGRLTPWHKSILDWLSSSTCPSVYRLSLKDGAKAILRYAKAKREAGRGWKKDPFVILDYGKCLRILGKHDDLCDLLRDEEYQSACFASPLYTLFQSLSEYFASLSFLFEEDEDYAGDVYDSECFRNLFASHRKKIYNSGLFLELKRCGFGKYLTKTKPEGSIEFEIGELYFYYISLSFREAYENLKEIERRFPLETIPLESRCEVERMSMLVCRKIVEFGRIEEIGPKTIEDAIAAGEPFEESLAWLTLSKVYCHELRKEDAYDAAAKAVDILTRLVEEETDGQGTQIEDHLFLAEDLRVYADAAIWHKDHDKAKELLDQAFAIYARYNQYDRYYPRTLYTALFYEIVATGDAKRIASLKRKAKPIIEESKDDYDLAQFSFLCALDHFLNKEYAKAEQLLSLAIAKNRALSVPVELLEAETLLAFVAKAQGKEPAPVERYNAYTDVWIDYVTGYIEDLRRNRHGS